MNLITNYIVSWLLIKTQIKHGIWYFNFDQIYHTVHHLFTIIDERFFNLNGTIKVFIYGLSTLSWYVKIRGTPWRKIEIKCFSSVVWTWFKMRFEADQWTVLTHFKWSPSDFFSQEYFGLTADTTFRLADSLERFEISIKFFVRLKSWFYCLLLFFDWCVVR